MTLRKVLRTFSREIPTLVVLSPLFLVFLLACWLCAKIITWLGVIFLITGIHWISRSYAPSVDRDELAKRSKAKVIIVGSGYSGLCMAIKLKAAGVPCLILEKSASLGGTWYDNTYPGCACDIMSHLYSFSFFPNPFWTTSFPSQPEILAYLRKVADHYDLWPLIRFGIRVDECRWDEERRLWTVTSTSGESFSGNFLVSGIGALHVPKIPDFPGKDDFAGTCFHTALWDHSFDYRGKDVAVIGTGASAVQAVPAMLNDVKSITVFQRTPVWTSPRLDFLYPRFVQALFNAFPLLMKLHRWYIFARQELGFFLMFQKDTKRGEYLRRQVTKFMHSQIQDPALREKLTPDFEMGCKRITVSNDYVRSFNSPKARLVTERIRKIVPEGVAIKKGEEEEEVMKFDAIIYATGFDLMASCKNITVVGKNGRDLGRVWGESPNAFLGISCPDFPNMFYLLGPNVGLGHNSVVWMIECQVTFCMDAILRCIREGVKSIDVKDGVNRKYQDYIQNLMKKRVFHSGCKSWYQNSEGIVFALWPSHLLHYWWITRKINMRDYNVD